MATKRTILSTVRNRKQVIAVSIAIAALAVVVTNAANYMFLEGDALAHANAVGSVVSIVLGIPIPYFVGLMILKMNALSEHLEHLVNYDGLTGAMSRRYFYSSVQSLDQQLGYAIICDLDRFKSINDNFGHAAGDLALSRVSEAIQNAVGESGFVCRLGGDEFVAFLHLADEKHAMEIAEKIRTQCSAIEIPMEGSVICPTISLGLSLKTTEQSLDDAIANADKALFDSKTKGRNTVSIRGNSQPQASRVLM